MVPRLFLHLMMFTPKLVNYKEPLIPHTYILLHALLCYINFKAFRGKWGRKPFKITSCFQIEYTKSLTRAVFTGAVFTRALFQNTT